MSMQLQVRARLVQQAAKTASDHESRCTFKPQVLEKSLRIAETLGTNFEKRQEIHMEKKKKVVSCVSDTTTAGLL